MARLIRTTIRPGEEILVDDAEYAQLLRQGLVYGEALPAPPDPDDVEVASFLDNETSQTYARLLAQLAAAVDAGTGVLPDALRAALVPRDNDGGEPTQVLLRSLPDPGGDNGVVTQDVTSRITLQSYQTAHYHDPTDEKPGEVLRMDVMDPVGKAMHAWRLPLDPNLPHDPDTNPMRTVTWVGAHWDSPPLGDYPIHGHWSVEVPNSAGRLETRFQVPFINNLNQIGTDLAQIRTTASDFVVSTSPAGEFGNAGGVPMFRIGGVNDTEKMIQFSTSSARNQAAARWQMLANSQTESGSNAGTNFVLQRLSDAGAFIENALYLERKTGRFGFGTFAGPASGPTDLSPGKFTVVWDGSNADTASGFFFRPSAVLAANGAVIRARMRSGTDRLVSSEVVGEAGIRYVTTAQGVHEWGDGTNLRDVNLYRGAVDVLRTDDDLEVATVGKGFILKSPDGTRYRISVANGGALTAVAA